MDLEKLIAFLKEKEASEDVVKFVEGLKPVTSETVKDYVENTDEGKKLLQSLTDAKVTKGIETFKTNNLPKILDDEIAKRYPPESEEGKKVRELEKRHNDLLSELKRKDLLTLALKKATEKRLPLTIVEKLLAEDEEGTEKNLNLFEEEFKKAIETQVNEKFKQGGRDIPGHPNPVIPGSNETSQLTKDLLNQV
jgi:hypothetical protein